MVQLYINVVWTAFRRAATGYFRVIITAGVNTVKGGYIACERGTVSFSHGQ